MLSEYDHLIHKYRVRFLDARLEPTGVAGPPAFYLMRIASLSPVRMNVIADEAPFHKSHATRAIMRLTELGLVAKTVDPLDQRGFILTLTPAGKSVAAMVTQATADWDALMAAALDDNERATLAVLTEKIYRNLHRHFEGDPER